jgi:hypothetical protein
VVVSNVSAGHDQTKSRARVEPGRRAASPVKFDRPDAAQPGPDLGDPPRLLASSAALLGGALLACGRRRRRPAARLGPARALLRRLR